MEDDTEVLDWGHEEEDALAVRGSEQRTFSIDDAEDAVSLGGDEEDEFLTYQSRVPQDTIHSVNSPPKSSRQPGRDPSRGRGDSPRLHHSEEQHTERTGSADQSSLPGRMHTFGTLVHALPPKPVVSSVPFVHPSHPSIIEATAMASRADHDKRNGAGSKTGIYDHNDSLPPGWEIKYPRNGRGVYYYNIHTQESTWTRPTAPTTRGERSGRRDDLDKALSTRNGEVLIPRVGRAESGDMSYGDRHYRPGETSRREERPAPPTQLIDSYVPDSYSPNHRNSRPSPPPTRTRERDPTPPPRRPPSPSGSHGDRDGVGSSHHEALSAAALSVQDRIWVARDAAPHERPRERRQRDDATLPETERRNLPRDTERSSTLRPRSPASYTRGSQESANTTPHSSGKPSHPVSEAPLFGRKNRLSQVDGSVQHAHRQSDSRDADMRRAHTDDVSHGSRHVDEAPNSRSVSDVRGDDDTPVRPASDAQRPGSRKRTPLPPQDELYRPGTRSGPAQRGGSHVPGPAVAVSVSVPENPHTGRIVPDGMPRELTRKSPSPPQPGPPPAERGDRDRGRSRWFRSYANGPPQVDPHAVQGSSRSRAHDIPMDVDDIPSPRLPDQPTKHIPLRRPALQDDVPRYPRAMLHSDNDSSSRVVREARDASDSRHRSAVDDSIRFGPSRDRMGMERQSADQITSYKEPTRGRGVEKPLAITETRPFPSPSSVKLSGTNNIPIGARNKFASNVAPINSRQVPPVTSGSNGDPGVSRRDRINKDYERPSPVDDTGDRGIPMKLGRREDAWQSPPEPCTSPLVEPATLPFRSSRAALGISRFGPPIVKENNDPTRLPTNVSPESLPSSQVPEGSSRATPPPPSRESSTTSLKDVAVTSDRLSQFPPRPGSPNRGYRHRSGDANKLHHTPDVPSPVADDFQSNEANAEASIRPKLFTSAPRKRMAETYPPEPSSTSRASGDMDMYGPQRFRTKVRDNDADYHVTLPPPLPVVPDEGHDRPPPPMHPERALMLQVNGLPPRPPSALGRATSARGPKRDRRDDREYDRAEPLRGNNSHFHSASPNSERRRYPEDDRPVAHPGAGASLLDRLSLDEGSYVNSPSLRDRVQLPAKRDREDMVTGEFLFDAPGEDYDGSRRVRRRGTKMRKGKV